MPDQERPRVLFVDDDENILRALSRLFIDENWIVLTAKSGAEGLDLIDGDQVAVVVSDQGMPGMKGAEFLEKVKEKRPDVVRMILTGFADLNIAIDAINRGGVFQYLTKPWDNDSLVMSIRAAVNQYKLVKENRRLTDLTRRQNAELERWNTELQTYVQQQTIDLTHKNRELLDLHERMRRNFRQFTVTMSNLIEQRDGAMANHSNVVAILSREIATGMGLSEAEVEDIAIAAQLHDIGKIGLSDLALRRPFEELDPEEVAEYRKHPVRGQAAVDSNEVFTKAGIIIRSHHERYDGSGFPDGLAGNEIPLGAQIVSISDRYDRLQRLSTSETALEVIWDLRDSQFDPVLYHPLERAVEVWMDAIATSDIEGVSKSLRPDELVPGMVLCKEVRSGTGILLLPKGARMDIPRIESLRRYFKLDPPESEVVCVRAATVNMTV
jgi:response regulator RpfG family c-di-GMP phosphodiesterase